MASIHELKPVPGIKGFLGCKEPHPINELPYTIFTNVAHPVISFGGDIALQDHPVRVDIISRTSVRVYPCDVITCLAPGKDRVLEGDAVRYDPATRERLAWDVNQ